MLRQRINLTHKARMAHIFIGFCHRRLTMDGKHNKMNPSEYFSFCSNSLCSSCICLSDYCSRCVSIRQRLQFSGLLQRIMDHRYQAKPQKWAVCKHAICIPFWCEKRIHFENALRPVCINCVAHSRRRYTPSRGEICPLYTHVAKKAEFSLKAISVAEIRKENRPVSLPSS